MLRKRQGIDDITARRFFVIAARRFCLRLPARDLCCGFELSPSIPSEPSTSGFTFGELTYPAWSSPSTSICVFAFLLLNDDSLPFPFAEELTVGLDTRMSWRRMGNNKKHSSMPSPAFVLAVPIFLVLDVAAFILLLATGVEMNLGQSLDASVGNKSHSHIVGVVTAVVRDGLGFLDGRPFERRQFQGVSVIDVVAVSQRYQSTKSRTGERDTACASKACPMSEEREDMNEQAYEVFIAGARSALINIYERGIAQRNHASHTSAVS